MNIHLFHHADPEMRQRMVRIEEKLDQLLASQPDAAAVNKLVAALRSTDDRVAAEVASHQPAKEK